MKTFLVSSFCTANTFSISVISQDQLIEVDNMLLFSQTTAPVDTKQRLFLFIEASNNIWHCHVCLRVKQCECVCVSGSGPSVCGKCGKAFVSYKSSKMETSAGKQPAVHDCRRLKYKHTHTPGSSVICGDASSWWGKYPTRKGSCACLRNKQHF